LASLRWPTGSRLTGPSPGRGVDGGDTANRGGATPGPFPSNNTADYIPRMDPAAFRPRRDSSER